MTFSMLNALMLFFFVSICCPFLILDRWITVIIDWFGSEVKGKQERGTACHAIARQSEGGAVTRWGIL